MVMVFRGLLAVTLRVCVCAAPQATTWPGADDNDMSLLQKSLRWDSSFEQGNKPIPELFVDLDAPPEVRWRNVTRYYKDMGVFPKLLQVNEEDILPESKALLQVLKLDEGHMRELRGIVADFADDLEDPKASLDGLVLNQHGYELSGYNDGNSGAPGLSHKFLRSGTELIGSLNTSPGGGSGLLAAMTNGTVVHVRNMDRNHDFPVNHLVETDRRSVGWPEVTVDVTFLRSGKPLITSMQWPGLIGIHTAMRHGGWSFEQNTRFHSLDTSIVWGLRGSHGYMLEVRKVMENTPDFETAVTELRELNLMAPAYFIVAGPEPYQGAVITMDRGGEHEPETPPVLRLGSTDPMFQAKSMAMGQKYTGSWHIIQTNDDQGGTTFDKRRPEAELRLAESTQDIVSIDWALSQLTRPPLYQHSTVFTSVYVPSWDYHRTVVHPQHSQ